MPKRKRRVSRLIACSVAFFFALFLHLRTHSFLLTLIADLAERRPPHYFLAYAAAMVVEFLPILALVGVLVYALLLRLDREPDYSAVDWQSVKPILYDLSHPEKNHGKRKSKDGGESGPDRWTPPGLIEEIAETYDTLLLLECCGPDGIPDAVWEKWGNLDDKTRRQWERLIDGIGDDKDLQMIFQDQLYKLLEKFMDRAGDFVAWYNANNPFPGNGGKSDKRLATDSASSSPDDEEEGTPL